ncbi:MAG: dTDP-4-dehydrorhamnose reductase, partial [Pusillimonas sp.]
DIADPRAVSRRVADDSPDWIINTAAYTAVDRAEGEAAQASAVNELGATHLAQAARDAGARLLHLSTDYVFDGGLNRPYTEQDAAGPLNEYGRGKLRGEHAVLRIAPQSLVLRTSGVYSEYGHNFVKTMLRLAAGGQPLRVVADQFACPTYAGDLANAIIGLIERGRADGYGRERGQGLGQAGPVAGIYHYCGATPVSWHAFARHIFQCARQWDGRFPVPDLKAIPASGYPGAAARPAYSVLSCEKIRALGIESRPLQATLPAVVRALME